MRKGEESQEVEVTRSGSPCWECGGQRGQMRKAVERFAAELETRPTRDREPSKESNTHHLVGDTTELHEPVQIALLALFNARHPVFVV